MLEMVDTVTLEFDTDPDMIAQYVESELEEKRKK